MKINTSKQGQEANTIRFNETTPLAQPQQPVLQPQTQPTQTLPSTPTQQVQPVQQVIHNHYSKSGGRSGCGVIGSFIWRLFTCIGCLLLILSIVIVVFAVWIHF
jgi:hypothetical protein